MSDTYLAWQRGCSRIVKTQETWRWERPVDGLVFGAKDRVDSVGGLDWGSGRYLRK